MNVGPQHDWPEDTATRKAIEKHFGTFENWDKFRDEWSNACKGAEKALEIRRKPIKRGVRI